MTSLRLKQAVRLLIARITGRAALRIRGETVRPTFLVSGNLERRKICALDREEEPLARFLSVLRPGDVVYDIGANLGLYAVPAAMKLAALGPDRNGAIGRVVAFEPVPAWAARLRQNARLNQLTNLDVFEVALSDTNGRAGFLMKLQPGAGMGSLVTGYERVLGDDASRRIEVEVSRGDTFAARQGLPAPAVLKVDVEGAEHAVLEGLASLLHSPLCRVGLVEIHHRLVANAGAVEELLAASGFTLDRGPERGSEYHVFATRKQPIVHRATGESDATPAARHPTSR
jgi:FkbM family methyltransferase